VQKTHRIVDLYRKLPSLNAVKVFEAAVRNGTTVGAAAELGVSHGAISRQIQQLEDWIGRPLFKRDTGRLVVTDAGAAYAEIAGRALDLLHDGTLALVEVSDNVVRITTTASFASEWLMQRLSDFRSRHPHIEIWVEEGKEIVNPRSGGCDLAIRMGNGEWPGVHVEPLMGDKLFPVCAPEIAGQLAHPRNLSKFPLLHDDDPHAQWSRWLSQADIEMTPARAKLFDRGSRFASSSLLLRAAAAGQGVALARERLAESWLESGKLARPFPVSVELDNAYWLVTRHSIEPRRPLRMFIAWMKQQAGTSHNS
jgi:LysR family glycine cleavage system transcriptional activator